MINEDDVRQRDRRRHHQIGMLSIYLAVTVAAMMVIAGIQVLRWVVALLGVEL